MVGLHIDIETYSSVDLKSCGVHKYTESPDFEIMLIAYAITKGGHTGDVKIIDLMLGDPIPEEFMAAYNNVLVGKFAHNAAFERLCFKAVGMGRPIREWHCSAVKSAYCGLPLGLDMVSKALKLEDKAKSDNGKKLIGMFCKPCKPTKINGGRHRNLPDHLPKMWEDFKEYCKQDVIAEMAVMYELADYEVPQKERKTYILDQQINDRGIMIDTRLATGAGKIDLMHSEEVKQELKKLTGVANPNSPAQLKEWLSDAMEEEICSLAKDVLPELIDKAEELGKHTVARVLNLRKKLAKTSVKKYSAMMECICDDERGHGFFQFYGASTGRWAGRRVQLQNLPRNYIEDLAQAKEIISQGDYEAVKLMYDEIPQTLSELIRTAFIAQDGHTFAVADFSAIEARVIAWLAGETWRIDVFNTHGKIYEASAAKMFKVPIESIGKGSDLRAKGKIAELALGYQGSVGALTQMGGDKMGLSETEMKGIVTDWREANPAVVKLWRNVENAAKVALKKVGKVNLPGSDVVFDYDGTALIIELPSGRKLFYRNPSFTLNKWKQESLRYKSVIPNTKIWGWVDTYGGKLTENIVQAIARDLLSEAMLIMNTEGLQIVMHVHDEAVCEVPLKSAEQDLRHMEQIMSEAPKWAEGLPLGADGYITPFYKKD